jgi:sporulation protein YlmC with PRC-barrel domain
MSKLLTTAAIVAITAGSAFAEGHAKTAEDQMAETGQMENAGAFPAGWNEDLDQRYAAIADTPVRDLLGINVLSEAGEDVGEIDTFVIVDNQLKAVVGVGGFLGLGEHDVALALEDLTWDGDAIVIPFTAEELEAMPQWTEEADFAALTETDTFRSRSDLESVGDKNAELGATQLAATPDAVELDEELAEAAEATENAVEEGAAEAEQMAENAAAEVGSWFERIEAEFGDLADAEINEFEGKEVIASNGAVIGEVEDIAMQGDKPVAIIGIGGFLGLGEHDVALDLAELGWNGERFTLDGYSEEDLKAMPEVDPNSVELLAGDVTLRARANM